MKLICSIVAVITFGVLDPALSQGVRGPKLTGLPASGNTEASLRIDADRIWGEFRRCRNSDANTPDKVTFVGLLKDNLRVSEPVRLAINAMLVRSIGGSQLPAVSADYGRGILDLMDPDSLSVQKFQQARQRIKNAKFFAEAKVALRTPEIVQLQIRLADRRSGCEDNDLIDVVLSLPKLNVAAPTMAIERNYVVLDGFLLTGIQAVAKLKTRTGGSFKAVLAKSKLQFEGSCIFSREIQSRLEGHYDKKRYEVGLLTEEQLLPPLSAIELEDGADPGPGIAVLRQTYRLRDAKRGTLSATVQLIHAGLKQTTLHRLIVVPPRELKGCRNAISQGDQSSQTPQTPQTPKTEPTTQPAPASSDTASDAGSSVAPEKKTDPGNPSQPAFVDICGDCPRMIRVRGPRAAMSGPVVTRGEKSKARVVMADFLVSETEITRGQFEAFVREAGYRATTRQRKRGRGCLAPVAHGNDWAPSASRTYAAPGFDQSADHPVVCVSWYDAQAYAKWLRRKTGRPFRLMSELEHERVNRAGQSGRFWWGDASDTTMAHFETGPGRSSAGPRATISTRALRANPWGFRHTSGNAAEWVADCWDASAPSLAADGLAPRIAGDCSRRVIKGGGWTYPSKDIAVAARDHAASQRAFVDVGFRVAADLN